MFLSYASQDAEAARRIADALRAAGVEVWFDQSELRGGDAWDQKIKSQIKACALFVPVISTHTQSRLEGYFRLEWHLAEQRTFLMAHDAPFLFPVVIDATTDAEARVPERFRERQWTRVRADDSPDPLVQRITAVLTGESGTAKAARSTSDPRHRYPSSSPPRRREPVPAWLVGVILLAVVVALLFVVRPSAIFAPHRSVPSATPEVSKARELALKAQAQIQRTDGSRAEMAVADDLCELAAAADPADAFVWAIWSETHGWYAFHNWDASISRRAAARDCTARALQLDPIGYESRLAQAFYWVRSEPYNHPTKRPGGAAEQLLRTLLAEQPDEPRALLNLAVLSYHQGKAEEAQALLAQLERDPAHAAEATKEAAWQLYLAGKVESG